MADDSAFAVDTPEADASNDDGPTDGQPATETASADEQAGTAAPMSKNKMKKLAKLQRIKERNEQRKAQEKQAKAERKAQRQAEMEAKFKEMGDEEAKAMKQQIGANREARKQGNKDRKGKLVEAQQNGPRLVIDLDFEGYMTEHDVKHLVQQLMHSYSINAKLDKPSHLHFLPWRGSIMQTAVKQLSGINNWLITKSESTYLEHFAAEKDKIVYLTADSPNELDELDDSKIYIIGGIVDHNKHKGLCQKLASEAGVYTARLPIQKYVKLDGRAVLTVNHVVHIMAEYFNKRDWQVVLDEVLPDRKRADKGAGKGKGQQGGGSDAEAAGTSGAGGSEQGAAGTSQQPEAAGDGATGGAVEAAEAGAGAEAGGEPMEGPGDGDHSRKRKAEEEAVA